MPSPVKLHGAPLSFRIASAGLGLCQTQSVRLIHPQRLQSAGYIQYYVTVHNRRSLGEIKHDITSIWEVNLVLRGLFSAWHALHPSLLLKDKCKCRSDIQEANQRSGEQNSRVRKSDAKMLLYFVFCDNWPYLNKCDFGIQYSFNNYGRVLQLYHYKKANSPKVWFCYTTKKILQPNCLNPHPFFSLLHTSSHLL